MGEVAIQEYRLVSGPLHGESINLPVNTEGTMIFRIKKRKGRYVRLGVPNCICADDNNLLYWEPK